MSTDADRGRFQKRQDLTPSQHDQLAKDAKEREGELKRIKFRKAAITLE